MWLSSILRVETMTSGDAKETMNPQEEEYHTESSSDISDDESNIISLNEYFPRFMKGKYSPYVHLTYEGFERDGRNMIDCVKLIYFSSI